MMIDISKQELFQLTIDMSRGDSSAMEEQIEGMIGIYERCLEALEERGE